MLLIQYSNDSSASFANEGKPAVAAVSLAIVWAFMGSEGLVNDVGAHRLEPVTRSELPIGSSALQENWIRTTRPAGTKLLIELVASITAQMWFCLANVLRQFFLAFLLTAPTIFVYNCCTNVTLPQRDTT